MPCHGNRTKAIGSGFRGESSLRLLRTDHMTHFYRSRSTIITQKGGQPGPGPLIRRHLINSLNRIYPGPHPVSLHSGPSLKSIELDTLSWRRKFLTVNSFFALVLGLESLVAMDEMVCRRKP